jgi:tubulin-specific chaperone E
MEETTFLNLEEANLTSFKSL